MKTVLSMFNAVFAALTAKILASHVVITLLGAVIISVFAAASGCTGSKAEPAAPPPAITASGSSTATPPPPSQATGTAAPTPTLLPPSPCGPGPCQVPVGVPSGIPSIPMLPSDYLTIEATSKHPKCLDRDASSRWAIVGPALGTGQIPVGHLCDNWDVMTQSFEAFPNSTSILFPKGALAVGDGENLSGLADVSKDLSPGGGKVDRHGRLSKVFPSMAKVRVRVLIDGAWTIHQWDDPILVYLAPTSSGKDAAIAPTDVCEKYKTIGNPLALSPWLQRIWSRCQMAPTPHNTAVIKTMDRIWTEQKDTAALAARVEKLEQLEGKVVKEVKASGDKPVPVQQIVGFNASAPN